MELKTNVLYYGDNLDILRKYIPAESIDLVYLDPPFNSNRDYNVIFKENGARESEAQIRVFTDTWSWTQTTQAVFEEIIHNAPQKVADLIGAMRSGIGRNDVMAYLVMMTVRLLELKRVLKHTGAIYLHCDPTASHYLKLVMDQIFGPGNFQNEIIWYYRGAGLSRRRFARRHDVLLFYTRERHFYFNPDEIRQPYAAATVERFRHYIGNVRGTKDYGLQKLHPLGKHPDDVWTDIQPIAPSAKARLSYPTQKPEELIERLIRASSRPGDVVLDPFCGCGTAVVAAHKLGRRWIGIDITHLAVALMKHRLKGCFGLEDIEVIGEPRDLAGARALAEQDRYQFQWWALSLVNAKPLGDDRRKGADRGIDGVIGFVEAGGRAKRAVVQVKSGHVNAGHIRDLKGTMEREKAEMGLFITLEEPTQPMKTEAVSAGFYHSELWDEDYPRIQICTIEELLEGKQPKLPRWAAGGFPKAQRIARREGEQREML
jgi:site-specific DNA-methyltransferase (adenine-specific)